MGWILLLFLVVGSLMFGFWQFTGFLLLVFLGAAVLGWLNE